MADISELIRRLEEATEGSRELDHEVLFACGWTITTKYSDKHKLAPYDWVTPDGKGFVKYGHEPSPTTSLDDVVTLIPGGWTTDIHTSDASPETYNVGWAMRLFPGDGKHDGPWVDAEIAYYHPGLDGRVIGEGCARAPALATCIAALRAREASHE